MDIIWHGHSCFTVKTKEVTIAIDPFKDIGLKEPKLTADILLVSHEHFDHSNVDAVKGEPKIVDVPGEYEYFGVMIEGIPTYHDDKEGADRGRNTAFSFKAGGVHFVHCGDLGHILDNDAVERIGDVDVLLIPVGGHFTVDAKQAAEIVKQLQPRVIVPMHYLVPGLKLDVLKPVDDFIKEVGVQPTRLEKPTWKLKSSDLPEEESQLVVFPNP